MKKGKVLFWGSFILIIGVVSSNIAVNWISQVITYLIDIYWTPFSFKTELISGIKVFFVYLILLFVYALEHWIVRVLTKKANTEAQKRHSNFPFAQLEKERRVLNMIFSFLLFALICAYLWVVENSNWAYLYLVVTMWGVIILHPKVYGEISKIYFRFAVQLLNLATFASLSTRRWLFIAFVTVIVVRFGMNPLWLVFLTGIGIGNRIYHSISKLSKK